MIMPDSLSSSFNYLLGGCNKTEGCKWRRSLGFFIVLAALVCCEIILASAFTGYMPNQFSFLLWENLDFLLIYFGDEPLETLWFVLIDRPIFVVESRQQEPSVAIWGLHFYSSTFIAHIVVALVLNWLLKPARSFTYTSRLMVISGCLLLVISSLHLYLSSCCTAGANWLLHTWMLAIVFDPFTANEFIIELYGVVNPWFLWLQILMVLAGSYLVYRGLKQKQRT
jgi:hypothetical protein